MAHTAANASPIRLKGTSAVPYLGGLCGDFFGDLRETTMVSTSVGPKGAKRDASEEAVVKFGCSVRRYFTRRVVSVDSEVGSSINRQ